MSKLQLTALVLLAGLGFGCSRAPESGDPRGGNLSGLILLVDQGTGCEYLYYMGGMLPRVDAEGKHICRPVESNQPVVVR